MICCKIMIQKVPTAINNFMKTITIYVLKVLFNLFVLNFLNVQPKFLSNLKLICWHYFHETIKQRILFKNSVLG